jgi:hypothetical protein
MKFGVAKRSLRDLLRRKLKGKKTLTPEMRDLLGSFEAQYGRRDTKDGSRSSQHGPDHGR